MKKMLNAATIFYPWTPILGIARTLLAICTLVTLLFNDISFIISKQYGNKLITLIRDINIFYVFSDNLMVAQILSIVILLLVIIGYFPPLSSILHWWVANSYMNAGTVTNGGDSIASILSLLLIPICIFDPRINHWSSRTYSCSDKINIFSFVNYLFIKIQICYIYFDACISKLNVPEWINGTAIWYYAHHSVFGFIDTPGMHLILKNAIVCSMLTYGTLVLEFLLAISIFQTNNRFKHILFISAVLFHFVISVEIGIISFAFTMFSALILLLMPPETSVKNTFNYAKKCFATGYTFPTSNLLRTKYK